MSLDLMRSLLRNFGNTIGLPDLAPDDDGYCCLRIGDKVTVSLQYEPEGKDIALFARLCQIPPVTRAEAYEMMLAANLFWAQTRGGTLAVEPTDGVVFLLMKEKAQALENATFNSLLENFVEAAEDWQQRLEPFSDELEAVDDGPAPSGSDLIRLS
jgi:hypothetical protein